MIRQKLIDTALYFVGAAFVAALYAAPYIIRPEKKD